MRKYTPLDIPKINRIDCPLGRRYQTPEGNLYPSVTTIFSVQENPAIDAWRARVGEEEATRIMNRAAQRGTWVHTQCEYYLKGGDKFVDPSSNLIENMLYFPMWKSLRPHVEKIGDVIALETPLWSDRLQVAGTVDCIGYWNGELSIIDFKTSSRRKARDEIDNYWAQTAAYSLMLYERTGLKATQLVIMMTVEEDDPLIYTDRVSAWAPRFNLMRKEYRDKKGE